MKLPILIFVLIVNNPFSIAEISKKYDLKYLKSDYDCFGRIESSPRVKFVKFEIRLNESHSGVLYTGPSYKDLYLERSFVGHNFEVTDQRDFIEFKGFGGGSFSAYWKLNGRIYNSENEQGEHFGMLSYDELTGLGSINLICK